MSKGYDEEDGRGPYLVLCILFWLVTTACQAKSCWSTLYLQSSMGGWRTRYMIWLMILMSCSCCLIWGSPPGLWNILFWAVPSWSLRTQELNLAMMKMGFW